MYIGIRTIHLLIRNERNVQKIVCFSNIHRDDGGDHDDDDDDDGVLIQTKTK